MSTALQGDVAWQFAKNATTAKEALDLAARAKEEGNKCFKAKSFDKAVAYYRTGLTKLRSARARKLFDLASSSASSSSEDGGEDEQAASAFETSFHLNVAMCLVKTKQWEDAITASTAALRKDPLSSKARLYRARAMMSSEHRQTNNVGLLKAKDDLEAAAANSPSDKVIAAELASVKNRLGEGTSPASASSSSSSSGASTTTTTTKPSKNKTTAAAADNAAQTTAAAAAAPQRIISSSAHTHESEEAAEADEEIRLAFKRGVKATTSKSNNKSRAAAAASATTTTAITNSTSSTAKKRVSLFDDERSNQTVGSGVVGSGEGVSNNSKASSSSSSSSTIPNGLDYGKFDRIVNLEESSEANQAAAVASAAQQQAARVQRERDVLLAEEAEEAAALAEAKGYRMRSNGTKVPAWSREVSSSDSAPDGGRSGVGGSGGKSSSSSSRFVSLPTPAPQRIFPPPPHPPPSTSAKSEGGEGAAGGKGGGGGGGGGHRPESLSSSGSGVGCGFNRSYKERDMTSWCVTGLLGRALRPIVLKLPDCQGTLRTFAPRNLKGEALMAGKLGKWDHTFDFNFSGQ